MRAAPGAAAAAALGRPRGVTRLMYAAQQGDVAEVRRIVREQPSSVLARDRHLQTALHYCAAGGGVAADAPPPPSAPLAAGAAAARRAHAADVIAAAAPHLVDARDDDGLAPLHLAVVAGNTQLVNFLLANGADPAAVDNERHTSVHWATVCGETASLRALLSAGAPVSTPDIHGGYPLHYAAQMCGGDKDPSLGLQVLHALLAHPGSDVNVTDGARRPPLLWAASAGAARAALALVAAGAAADAADRDGLTALHCAASRGHADVLDALLTLCGATVDLIDGNGCTALHYAVTLGHADATALLLAHGADPNRQDRKGRSPAHCGCAKGQFETVKLIAANGANLWLKNARGDLPLHDAAASGRRELVQWLLDMRPSQVNARNNDGRCPLHMAALNDNSDMCKILLDAGANVNPVLRTSKNLLMTPLDCALQRGFRSTAKYLQLHGGVPASRLGTPTAPHTTTTPNLQIREDVTFYGESSSGSEKDKEVSNEKGKRRSYKRRQTKRKERRKEETQEEDSRSEEATPKKKNSTEIKNLSSSRIDYTNEIIINGKTEINIHQTKEISIENDSETPRVAIDTSEKVIIPSSKSPASEKRPKSAKYSKIKEGSSRPSSAAKKEENLEKSVEETIIQTTEEIIQTSKDENSPDQLKKTDRIRSRTELRRSFSLREPSTNTSEETSDTVVDAFKYKRLENEEQKNGEEIVENNKSEVQNLPDQQSITSEDIEQTKTILTEAAVHQPPKEETEKSGSLEKQPEDTKTEEKSAEETQKEEQNQLQESKDDIIEKEEESVKVEETKQETDAIEDENEDKTEAEVPESQQNEIEELSKKLDKLEAESEQILTESVTKVTEEETKDSKDTKKVTRDHSQENGDIKTKSKKKSDVIKTKEDSKIKQKGIAKKKEEISVKKKISLESKEPKKKEVLAKPKAKQSSKDQSPSPTTTTATEEKKKKPSKKSKKPEVSHEEESPEAEESSRSKSRAEEIEEIAYSSLEESYTSFSESELSPKSKELKDHKSFRVLDDVEADKLEKPKPRRKSKRHTSASRSKSDDSRYVKEEKMRKTKMGLQKTISKSDRHLDSIRDSPSRVPALPGLPRGGAGGSQSEDEASAGGRGRRRSRRRRAREGSGARSAGADDAAQLAADSGFEPSPRSSRIPRWRRASERGPNMESVTRSMQGNIRRYHLERKIFQHLLELKRSQIRAGQHNEAVLVKRAIEQYHSSCASTVGAGRYTSQDFSFRAFEKFLYDSLRKLQRADAAYLKGLPAAPPENPNPLLCARSTHRCQHAAHAYTGVPCAAYLPKMDHHNIPKIGFEAVPCKPGTGGFLPDINRKKAVTLELSHGSDKQIISLPTDRLDQNKRYYVTFTVKGRESTPPSEGSSTTAHRHSKSE